MTEKLNEQQLFTPAFFGNEQEINAALNTWTNLVSTYSCVSSISDSKNKLAILNSIKSMIESNILELTNPTQVATQAAKDLAVSSPPPTPSIAVDTPSLTVQADFSTDETNKCNDCEEEEEEIESGAHPNPSTEIVSPEVQITSSLPPEVDKDKKAVVDLTIESTKGQISESTKRMLELAGLRAKI
jgi:hypothetical protein